MTRLQGCEHLFLTRAGIVNYELMFHRFYLVFYTFTHCGAPSCAHTPPARKRRPACCRQAAEKAPPLCPPVLCPNKDGLYANKAGPRKNKVVLCSAPPCRPDACTPATACTKRRAGAYPCKDSTKAPKSQKFSGPLCASCRMQRAHIRQEAERSPCHAPPPFLKMQPPATCGCNVCYLKNTLRTVPSE